MQKFLLGLSLFMVSNVVSQEIENPTTTTTTTTVVTTTTLPIAEKKIESYKKNELRVDPFYLIFSGAINVNYERVIDEESGFGVTLVASSGKEINTRFSLSPYYRMYFGKKTAAGFFFEGFAMYSSFDADRLYTYSSTSNGSQFVYYETKEKNINDLAIGLGLGGKWITRKGIIFEISTGIGRNLLNDYDDLYLDNQIAFKGGISIGKRF
jgi:hypothetical protein